MYHDHNRSSFDDAAPTTIPTASNTVPPRSSRTGRAAKTTQPPKRKPRKYAWGELVREDVNLSANAKVVAWYLSGLFDADEEAAFPTHATITKRTGLKNQKAVQRAIRELEGAEYLAREMGTGILGGNKYRANWAKLSERLSGDDSSDLPGDDTSDPWADSSDLPGMTAQTPIIQVEQKLEDEHQEKPSEDKTRPDAGAPALPARPTDASLFKGDEDCKAAPVAKRQSWNDEYDILVSRFPGNPMGTTYRGNFCGIRQRNFTLDDVLLALEYDTKLANPNGEARCMASFLNTYFAGQDAPGDVQHWKDQLAEAKRKADAPKVKVWPKAPAPRAVLEMAAERRAREAARAKAFEISMRSRVEEIGDEDDDDL